MNTTWKTIRIFISSTFRDMHTERDHLVRFVFPELKEKCRKKHVHLIDVDLRWGVTEADVQDGKALDICMDEIDTCRPYFLGLLGHCYGSIPPGETYSITAQEIFHGVLHNDIPTQVVDLRRIIEGKLEGKMLTNKQINCLVRCYRWNTDKSKYLLSVDATDDELEIIRSVFKKYSVYQRDRSFFFFRSESLTRKLAGKKIDELTDRERVNQHKLDELKEKIKDGFIEKEKVNQDKLADLKQDIIDAKLPYFKYDDIEAFGEKVKEVLWERIEAELGEPLEEEKDWLEEEAEFHDLFIEDRTRRFVGRRKLLDRMNDFCGQNCEPSVMVITGEPGCGKSALMGRFSEEIILNHPDWLIIPHFVGSSPDSTSLRQTLKRLCTYLHKQLDEKDEVPEDIKELKQIFPDWLAKAAEQRRILIILDAVNQLEKTDNAHAMQWLPLKLPENVRYMISTLEGEAHDALMVRRDKPEEVRVAGLDKQEIKKLVHDYLKEIRKDFPNKDAEKTFYEKIKLGNPLYILVALEELRVFGDFYGLPKKIKRLPGNVPELFGQILERIEYDFSKPLVKDCMALIACGRQGMTAEELQALLAAYAPQHDDMIPAYRLPDMTWARLYRTFRSYLFERSGVIDFFHGQLKEAVEKRYLREEVDQNATHKIIADYFEKRWREPYNRALEELPHQLTKAADWSGIERVLCDLQFIEAKCAARMTYKLIVDYNTALSSLPDAQQEIQIERRYQARLNKYVDEMAYYAEAWNEAWSSHVLNPKINPMPQIGKIKVPDIVSSIKPWTEEEIAKKQEKVICNPTRLNRIRAFSKFVNKEYHYLKEVVLPPGFAIQLAYNSARNGPVFDLAKNLIDHNQKDLFLLKPSSQKPTFLQDSALLRVIDTGNDAVDTIDLSADGKIAVTKNGTDSSLVWDIQSGRLISNLEGIPTYNIALSLNSKTAISLSKKRLQVWDVQNGKILKILKVGSIYRKSLKVTSDGRLLLEKVPELNSFSFRSLFSTRYARIVGGWLEVLFRKAKKEKLEFGHFVTANNKVMVAAGRRNSVIVLDMNIGLIINSYKKTKFFISEAVVSLDNRIAVTAGHNIYSHKVDWLGIWDLTTGKCLHSPWTVKEISSLALTPDGRLAISGHEDGTLRVWEVTTGKLLSILKGHSYSVRTVALNPDGRFAISGGLDNKVLFWDITTCLNQFKKEVHKSKLVNVDLSLDGRFAVSVDNGAGVKLSDVASGSVISTLSEGVGFAKHDSPGESYSAAITPDSRQCILGWSNNKIESWDLNTLKSKQFSNNRVEHISNNRVVLPINLMTGKAYDYATVSDNQIKSFSPCGRIGLLLDGTIWDIKEGKCLMNLWNLELYKSKFSPDGRFILGINTNNLASMKICDLETKDNIKTLTNRKNYQTIRDVYFSIDGRFVLSNCDDRLIRIWGVNEFWCKCISMGESSSIYLYMSPDGRKVICINNNGLKVFDLRSGILFASHEISEIDPRVASFTPNGRYYISARTDYISYNNMLQIWDMKDRKLVAMHPSNDCITTISKTISNAYLCYGTYNGCVTILALHNFFSDPPITTPVRIWQYCSSGEKGHWDKNISALCYWCGLRFQVEAEMLDVIEAVNRDNHISPNDSPCLKLPDEAWDEPKLLSECPYCHKPLRFNPFIIDNRERR